MGYDIYRRLANGINIKNKTTKEALFKCLVDPGPDIVGKTTFLFFFSREINCEFFSG